ncbi:MAG: ABC transporter permease [Eubacteriales bacterium]|nr:ABC transporter permease [Eubacteriales bacterium]
MRQTLYRLTVREVKRALNVRSISSWTIMAAMCVYFFFASAGWHKLSTENRLDFMSLFIPQLIFGAWAALTVFYDLMSADREHNVLDMLLTSGVTKSEVFISKTLAACAAALFMTFLYLLPVAVIVAGMTGTLAHLGTILRYALPLWGYIMVHASLGFLISVLARSSKAALIWSMAAGLFLMPRFYVMLLEAIGGLVHLADRTIDALSLLSPGVLMNALADPSDAARFRQALIGFAAGSLGALLIAFRSFLRQDELNYGG